jgi:hypothetical protein
MRTYIRGDVDVARSYRRIAALVPSGGAGLVTVLIIANMMLGLLPVLFVLATARRPGAAPRIGE